MANTTLQVKKSGVTGNVPSSLEYGELALNYADGKLYYKDSNSVITYIQSGTTTDSFATINANSSLILATSPTDTLSIAAGNNITISACTVTKTITINSQDADVDQFARNTGNAALNLAQSAYDFANTISGGSAIDNVARVTAQAAWNTANGANGLAQGAYNQANTNSGLISIIDGINTWQNTEITYVNQFAQAAFDKANTGAVSALVTISDENTSNNVYYINFVNNTSGNANTLYVSSNNLTFNPSTGSIGIKVINLTSNTNISSNTISLTDTTPVVVDSFSTSIYRSAFYQVQLSSPGGYHVLNLNIVHNGTSVFANTFGDAYSSILGTFSANIVGTTLNVTFTPTVGTVTVAFIRNAIAKIGVEAPAGSLGFVGDPVTAIFNAGFDLDPATSSFDYGTVS